MTQPNRIALVIGGPMDCRMVVHQREPTFQVYAKEPRTYKEIVLANLAQREVGLVAYNLSRTPAGYVYELDR